VQVDVQPSKPRRGRTPLAWRDARDGYLFIMPWLLGFVVFTAFPMGFSFVLTFMDWDLLGTQTWAGLANYQKLVSDALVGVSLYNTAYFTFFSVPLRMLVALGAALLLNSSVRGLSFFRTFFYLPTVVPAVASVVLWMYMFNPSLGLLNMGMSALGLPRLNWLWDIQLSKPSLILMTLWTTGNVIIIYLAGLQAIPTQLYEAARIDGAGAWAQFRNVTLPMLSPSILFNVIMGIIGSFQVFTNAFLMTAGGPLNSTLFTVLYLYRAAFEQFKMGYASSIAWVLFVIVLIFTLIQWKLANVWVYYEGAEQ
jgi:multiple sugar transport system permease protein